jgi:hypothetical protein
MKPDSTLAMRDSAKRSRQAGSFFFKTKYSGTAKMIARIRPSSAEPKPQ